MRNKYSLVIMQDYKKHTQGNIILLHVVTAAHNHYIGPWSPAVLSYSLSGLCIAFHLHNTVRQLFCLLIW